MQRRWEEVQRRDDNHADFQPLLVVSQLSIPSLSDLLFDGAGPRVQFDHFDIIEGLSRQTDPQILLGHVRLLITRLHLGEFGIDVEAKAKDDYSSNERPAQEVKEQAHRQEKEERHVGYKS